MAKTCLTREHLKALFNEEYDKVGQPCPRTSRDRVLDHDWRPLQEQFALLEAIKEDNPLLKNLSSWPRVSVSHELGERVRVDDSSIEEQTDVTDMFFKACRSLKHNELVLGENFDLLQAMIAAELMEPKMDSGMEKRIPFVITLEKVEFIQAQKWTEIDHITLCDAQLALMASWLINVESLDTTVFTSIMALHPECAQTDPILRAMVNSCNWLVSMFINLVESAETIAEEVSLSQTDSMNRKTIHRFCPPSYREVMDYLDEAIKIINSENSFNKNLFIGPDGNLKDDRPSLRTYKEAIAVRLLFFKSLIEAIACAFPLLTRIPEPKNQPESSQAKQKKPKKPKKPKKKKAGTSAEQETPDVESMSKNFRLAYAFVSLTFETTDFGRAPPQGYDYDHIYNVRNMGKISKERTVFNEIASGFYEPNPDGDYGWLPTIIPDLSFHYLPNNFPHEVKMVSRIRGIYFFGHFLQEMYEAIQAIPAYPWALDEIFATFYKFQKLHVIARSFLELTILTSKLKIMYYYNLEDLTENGIDDFSSTYKMKQLFALAFMISLFSHEPLPYFNLDEPDWPILDDRQLIEMNVRAPVGDQFNQPVELRRFSFMCTLKQLIYDLSRVHSHHLQYSVHSMFHFRSRMCISLADLYSSFLPKALKLEAGMDRSMMSYNRKALQDHIDMVKKEGGRGPLPQRFTGCPALISTYIQYHTFMLVRTHIQQTLHLEIVPMAELDMVMFIYLCVLRRFGSLIRKQITGFDTFTRLPIPDAFDRTTDEMRALKIRSHESIFQNMLIVAAEVQMCLVVIALVQIRKREGLLHTPPNQEILFKHRAKQSIPQTVREEYELWHFNPTYGDFKMFLNFMNQDYLTDRPPCKSTAELCTYANVNFLRAKELYTHTASYKKYAKELGCIDSFLQGLSQGNYPEKNAFKLIFPYIDNIMVFDIQFPGAPETRPPFIFTNEESTGATRRMEQRKDLHSNVDKLAESLQEVQIKGETAEKKKKKGKK